MIVASIAIQHCLRRGRFGLSTPTQHKYEERNITDGLELVRMKDKLIRAIVKFYNLPVLQILLKVVLHSKVI